MVKFKFYALWLSLVCILIFVIQNLIGGFTEFFLLNGQAWGAVWRFVSAIFLHSNIGHLLYNIFALALFGSILEKFIGGKKFLIVFLVSGVLANLIAVNFYSSSFGASGAIFGILGALVIIKPKMMVWAFGFPMPMILAGVIWIAGDLIGFFYLTDGVGYMAHFGGMGVGFIFGVIFRSREKIKKQEKIIIDEQALQKWEDDFIIKS